VHAAYARYPIHYLQMTFSDPKNYKIANRVTLSRSDLLLSGPAYVGIHIGATRPKRLRTMACLRRADAASALGMDREWT